MEIYECAQLAPSLSPEGDKRALEVTVSYGLLAVATGQHFCKKTWHMTF